LKPNEQQILPSKDNKHQRVVDDILYRTAEDNYEVYGSVYNARLGRKKTMEKIMQRMYRPILREAIVEAVKTCHAC
jgi:hypothetical protein